MRLGLGLSLCLASSVTVLAVACGSSPEKKPARYTSGGEGGEAGSTSSGSGGKAGSGGNGGDAESPLGGAGGDGAIDQGGAGGAGGDGNVKPFHGLYVSTTGDDMADGTADAPFKTLTHAASLAMSGDTIVFLDGTFSETALVVIPAGVDLLAQNSGSATLKGTNNSLLSLEGSTRIEGLKFQTYNTVVAFAAGATATGTVTIVDSSFTQCQVSCLSLSGSAAAEVSAPADFVLGSGGTNFATLANASTLAVKGGVLQSYTGGNIFSATDDAYLNLENIKVDGGTAQVLFFDKTATGAITGANFATMGQGIMTQRGESVVKLNDSDLSMKAGATPFQCVRLEMNGLGGLTITNSKLHDCNGGFSGTLPATLALTNVEVYNMAFGGMDLGYGAVGVGGAVHLTGCDFHDVATLAVRLGNDSNLNDFKFRDSKFSNSPAANSNTIYLQGSAASSFDLGTLADPGGNTFINGNAAQTALWIGSPGVYANAVGNTWTPNKEGADPQGHYSAPAGMGKKLEGTPVDTGQNYQVPYNGAKILLAQNP